MLKTALARLRQGYRTIAYPDGPPPAMPDRFCGCPSMEDSLCVENCTDCVDACPTGALAVAAGKMSVDLGKCLFCRDCAQACGKEAISFAADYRLAVRHRNDLIVDRDHPTPRLADALDGKLKRLFGRSLKLRQVSAGGCNACEADVNVLGTVGWDLGRFGIQFVASPRHADGLLITGPVTENMRLALQKTYDAVAEPKIVIAVGACAISGGIYIAHPQAHNGAENLLPIDLYIPGCPPHPLTILDGLLRFLGRIEDNERVSKS